MPTDVTLGEGRTGEALLTAFPNQYRDAATESHIFDTGAPGASVGRPMAVGDPDMPAHNMKLVTVPGVGQVVAVDHTMPGFGMVAPPPTDVPQEPFISPMLPPKPEPIMIPRPPDELIEQVALAIAQTVLSEAKAGKYKTLDQAIRRIVNLASVEGPKVNLVTPDFITRIADAATKAVTPNLKDYFAGRPHPFASKGQAGQKAHPFSNWGAKPNKRIHIAKPPLVSSGPRPRYVRPVPTNPGYTSIRGISPYPQDLAGMGETDAEKAALAGYYQTMLDRGLEIAENVKSVTDQWVTMQATKDAALGTITEKVIAGTPLQDDQMVSQNLMPALDKIRDLFAGPEESLKDLAALQGWLEDSVRIQVTSTMEQVRAVAGIGPTESSRAEAILASVSAGRPAPVMYAENWILAVFAAVGSYIAKVAPDLSAAKTEVARQQKMAGVIRDEIQKNAPEIMAKYGVSQDEMNQALQQVGLGIIGLVILAVILAIGMTAASAAALYYRGVAKSAADEGVKGVAKINAAWQDEYQKLLTKAQAGADAIAAEADPDKRVALAGQKDAEMNAAAGAAGARLAAITDAVKDDIAKAKPGSLDLGSLVVPGVIVIGAAIALKAFGVF
jgi:hypothetical protein